MTLRFYDNLGVKSHNEIKKKIDEVKNLEIPFASYESELGLMKQKAFKYSPYRNIVVLGYGGSVSSFRAMYGALGPTGKNVEIVDTMDIDRLNEVKSRCPKDDTIVIAISKSGNTVGVIETLFFFNEYKTLVITSENDGALMNIVRKRGIEHLEHPEIGGRYSARTATGYFPAIIAGLDVEGIEYGFQKIYKICNEKVPIEKNPALHLAASCAILEQEGYTELYMPFYCEKLDDFSEVIVQLIHESSCKDGVGQSIYTARAPEAQHHTNQRIFGGRKNVVCLFVRAEKFEQDKRILVPIDLIGVDFKDMKLSIFEGISYSSALSFEFQGTYNEALRREIPSCLISLNKVDTVAVGELLGFFQYYAVYASYLRGVDPFNQPHVENSKRITLDLIRRFGHNA